MMNLDRYQKIVLTYAIAVILFCFPYVKETFQENSNINTDYKSWALDPNEDNSLQLEKVLTTCTINKKDIVVAIIDTGIQYNHPFLKNNIFIPKRKTTKYEYGFDLTSNHLGTRPADYHGHGTHIAGIIKSVSNNVKLLPLKYYDKNSSGEKNLKNSLKALKVAIENNVDIINYSGGGPQSSLEEYELLKKAERKGILVIVAGGNESENVDIRGKGFYPASYLNLSNIISVTAHDKNNRKLSSSNWGNRTIDIIAPGYKINSSVPKGNGIYSGTSQATAFVTGLASLIKEINPELKTYQIKDIILKTSDSDNYTKTIVRSGRLNLVKAIKYVRENLDQPKFNNREIASKNN